MKDRRQFGEDVGEETTSEWVGLEAVAVHEDAGFAGVAVQVTHQVHRKAACEGLH